MAARQPARRKTDSSRTKMRLNCDAVAVLIERSGYRNRSHFAQECGITPGTLTALLQGQRNASPALIEQIRKALAVPLPAILRDPEAVA